MDEVTSKRVLTKMASEETFSLIDMFIFDELLECIFNYLSLPDLIVIERVSKRWQRVSLTSWRSRKKIDLTKQLGYRFPPSCVKEILQRSGNYVIHLDLSGMLPFIGALDGNGEIVLVPTHIPEKDIFSAITQYCKRLVTLKVHLDNGHGKNLHLIDDSIITNLKVLCVDFGRTFKSKAAENRLSSIIKKAVNLEEFELDSQHNIEGSCLLNLPKSCKKLLVDSCYDLDDVLFTKVVQKLPNLRDLNISYTYLEPESISSVCNQLLSLDIGGCEEFFKDCRYKVLSFENLQKLNIECNELGDNAFCFLIDNCPLLQSLHAGDLDNVSDNAFRYLKKLKSLKYLNLCRNKQITDSTLVLLAESLNSLEEFKCGGCKQLKCSGLLSLINSCKDLRYLQIEGLNVTNEFFVSALKSVDKRSKNVSLTVRVSEGTPKGFKCLKPKIDRPLKYNYCEVVEEKNE